MPYVIARDQTGKLIRKAELKSAPVTIGRSSTCDLCIPDTNASRHHCQLTPAGRSWIVRDLDSRNGTYINGLRITQHTLRDGDVIEVGHGRVAFYAGAMRPTRALDPVMAGLTDAETMLSRATPNHSLSDTGIPSAGSSSLYATRVVCDATTADDSTLSGTTGVGHVAIASTPTPRSEPVRPVAPAAVTAKQSRGFALARLGWAGCALLLGGAAVFSWLHWG